ncbi:MAG: phosphotransferase family protein [Pseudomonadota bacterium]
MTSVIHDKDLAERFAAYVQDELDGASNVEVTMLARIHGGASRETYSIDLSYKQGDTAVARGVILRRDPPDSLIHTERKVEFAAIQSVQHADIPVPKALFLEESGVALGAPFFVMERIETGVSANPFQLEAFDPHRETIGRQVFRHIGRIAQIDLQDAPIVDVVDIPAADMCWSRELDYWEREIDTHARQPQAIAKAAIRHLRRNPPPPAQRLSIVHGDYRVGNFLHDEAGRITAVLDWEMAHIGDPYEDFAWACDPLWSGGDITRAAGLLPWPEAIAEWELASGCKFSFDAYEWWSIFASVKAIGIWISSARAFADARNDDPILAWSGWFTHAAHERILSARLASKYRQ